MAKVDTSKTISSTKNYKLAAAIAALLAIGFHGYLLKIHLDLNYGEVTGPLLCDVSAKLSCSTTSASRWSELFNVPMALWGILANIGYLVFSSLEFLSSTDESRNSSRTAVLLTAGTIALASIVMGTISLTMLDTVCPFCAVTYLLSFVTFGCALWGYKSELKPKLQLSFLWTVIVLGIAAFVISDQLKGADSSQGGGNAMAQAAISEWAQNPDMGINENDPLATGPERNQAKMTIVEFADFRCIHCKHAAPVFKAFTSSHPDVRLEFYSWPLDGECNTSIQQPNGASCLLARVVWCARKKANRGWEAHEAVFNRFEEWISKEKVQDSLDSLANQIGMNGEELKSCASSTEAKSAIEKQAQAGTSLSLRGTPAIFVNGKSLPAGASLPILNAVYRKISKK